MIRLLCLAAFFSFWALFSYDAKTQEQTPLLLSDWSIFKVSNGRISLSLSHQPYTVQAPLFSDYAWKWRSFSLPEGTQIVVRSEGRFDFPDGSIIAKTFYYPRGGHKKDSHVVLSEAGAKQGLLHQLDIDKFKLVETRVLHKTNGEWLPYVYIWNELATDAKLFQQGGDILLKGWRSGNLENQTFDYFVPSKQQCSECHGGFSERGDIRLLGLEYAQLAPTSKAPSSTVNQVEHLVENRRITFEHKNTSMSEYSEPKQARDYMHVNCAHCHNPKGVANSSGLFLERGQKDIRRLGVCKPSIAAGRGALGKRFDVVPGRPRESILLLRMKSIEPDIRMPEVGRSLQHTEGVHLISDWIKGFSASKGGCL